MGYNKKKQYSFSLNLNYPFDVIWCIEYNFPHVGISTGKLNNGEVILQIPSSLCPTSVQQVINLKLYGNIRLIEGYLTSLCTILITLINKPHI
jgi:hypothetical protein